LASSNDDVGRRARYVTSAAMPIGAVRLCEDADEVA